MICFKVTTLMQLINKNHYWIIIELSDVVTDNRLYYIYVRKGVIWACLVCPISVSASR